MPDRIVRVKRHLVGKKPPGIAFELTERELAAIGEVTVQWAYLEHQILEMTVALATVLGKPTPQEAAHFSFDRRLNYLKTILKSPAFTNEESRKEYLHLLQRVHRLKVDRQKIGHGLWDWDYSDPYTPIVSSKKPGHEFVERFDFKKIITLVERISEINFKLTFPDGLSAKNHPNSYMSRQAVALFMGDAELSPKIDLDGPKRRRRRGPSSSSDPDRSAQ